VVAKNDFLLLSFRVSNRSERAVRFEKAGDNGTKSLVLLLFWKSRYNLSPLKVGAEFSAVYEDSLDNLDV
jgi:hypothetical protein